MSMRIAFDITSLSDRQSGVGNYATNLLAHLQTQEGLGLELLPVSHQSERQNAQVRHHNKTVWMQFLLPGELARGRVDLCHFTNSVASLRCPCPTVVTIHDMTLWLTPEHHYLRRLMTMRPIIPLVARRASAIIAVSAATKRDVVRILGVPAAKVHVIHEAAAPVFRPLPGDASELAWVRNQLHLPPHFLLYVGTIEPRKNLVRLLEAFAGLWHGKAISQHLVLAGQRGWKDEAVFAAIERLNLKGAVRYLGYVPQDQLVALYNLADAFVFPSLYEGFGLPIVEAMTCGLPVITANGSALCEVAGEAAELVDPHAVESIADGLYRVLTQPQRRAELRVCSLARAAAFSWAASARQTAAVYRRV